MCQSSHIGEGLIVGRRDEAAISAVQLRMRTVWVMMLSFPLQDRT